MQRTTLYVPFNASTRGSWSLRRNAEIVGQYPTFDDALRHARALTVTLQAQQGLQVEIKVEDEAGLWHQADAVAGPH